MYSKADSKNGFHEYFFYGGQNKHSYFHTQLIFNISLTKATETH